MSATASPAAAMRALLDANIFISYLLTPDRLVHDAVDALAEQGLVVFERDR